MNTVAESIEIGTRTTPTVGSRSARFAGAIIWLASTATLLVGLYLWARSGFAIPPFRFMNGPLPMLAAIASVIAQSTMGSLLALRRPGNPLGWLFAGFGLNLAFGFLIWCYAAFGLHGGVDLAISVASLAWVQSWALVPISTWIAVVAGTVFPAGRLLSPRWRWALVAVTIGAMAAGFGVATTPGTLLVWPGIPNPVPEAWQLSWAPALQLVGWGVLAATVAAAGVALITRLRLAVGVERDQVKLFSFSGAVFAALGVLWIAAIVLLDERAFLGQLILSALVVGMAFGPTAAAVAILRHGLYDIDRLISNTVVYAALTAILAGIYTASLRLFQALFVAITGDRSDAAIVITTLILATTFTPIKQSLEGIVSSRLGTKRKGAASVEADHLLRDPAFMAAIDERIQAAIEAAGDSPDAAREAPSPQAKATGPRSRNAPKPR